jgi:hypothetical protein
VSGVQVGDLWEFLGDRRRRKALPVVSVAEIEQGGGRALLHYTFPYGRMLAQHRWCSIKRLQKAYRLVARQEQIA